MSYPPTAFWEDRFDEDCGGVVWVAGGDFLSLSPITRYQGVPTGFYLHHPFLGVLFPSSCCPGAQCPCTLPLSGGVIICCPRYLLYQGWIFGASPYGPYQLQFIKGGDPWPGYSALYIGP